jgi:outer membrane protein assembly factor BamA
MRNSDYSSAFKLTSLLLVVLVNLSGPLSLLAQEPAGEGTKLAKIEFVGLKRLKAEQLIKVSGLEIGQAVNVEALDAAAQRLLDSGLVHKLGYHLQTKAGLANVTFQIEEGRGGESAVIFDNFIWFTDEELGEAVRREVPTFNGSAPNSGNMIEAITRGLQRLLTERKIAVTIDYLLGENADHTKLEHVFSVKGAHLPICSLHFPGAHSVSEEKLIKHSQELLGTDYSRRFAGLFAFNSLFPIYRELGQLRATFERSQARPETTANCQDGVELTISIDEGATYVWDKSEWAGNQVLTQQELDAALAMKSGEIANGLKFDKGLAAVMQAYGHKGYLSALVRPQPDFDDSARKVAYQLEVKEGPQYHMGTLTVKGFSDNLGNYLRGKWEMKRGDIYDRAYVEEFFKKDFREIMRKVNEERQEQGRPNPKKITTEEHPHRDTLTVDVTFEIGD